MPDIRSAVQRDRDIRAELLAQFPELAEDEQALRDTLQGASNLDRAITALITEALYSEAQADGISAYIKTLQERRARLVARGERLRGMALYGMTEGGIEKLNEPLFTASLGKAQPAVNVYDEAALPESYWRVKREPDKTEIGKALKDGVAVPGATLGNRRAVLTVRQS